MASADDGPDASLKRLGGGRWQTRDERFTIEPQSGTWVVVDAEQTDDLGLPLVRGPFRSLTDTKAAIAEARSAPATASPLADRIGRRPMERAEPQDAIRHAPARTRSAKSVASAGSAAASAASAQPSHRSRDEQDEGHQPVAEPEEPRWFAALEPDARRRARRLIARLEEAGALDPEGMARRDIVGDVAAVAAFAIERRLEELPDDARVAAVASLLAEGRDESLGVRWRLVDDEDRPITLDPRLRRGGRNRER